MIERKKPDIFIPSGALRLAKLRLDYQQRRLAFAREDRKIIALHGPVIREVQDIIRRANPRWRQGRSAPSFRGPAAIFPDPVDSPFRFVAALPCASCPRKSKPLPYL